MHTVHLSQQQCDRLNRGDHLAAGTAGAFQMIASRQDYETTQVNFGCSFQLVVPGDFSIYRDPRGRCCSVLQKVLAGARGYEGLALQATLPNS